ncbi:MAG: hypothetical protein ACREM3_24570, partial [Candidatus Rokuibacteriota bacterium]
GRAARALPRRDAGPVEAPRRIPAVGGIAAGRVVLLFGMLTAGAAAFGAPRPFAPDQRLQTWRTLSIAVRSA